MDIQHLLRLFDYTIKALFCSERKGGDKGVQEYDFPISDITY